MRTTYRRLPLVIFALAICFACTTSAAYKTIGTVAQARDTAMQAWAQYYVSKTPGGNGTGTADLEAAAAKVKAADAKYLASLKVFRDSVVVAYSDKTTAPEAVAAAAADLVSLIKSLGVKL